MYIFPIAMNEYPIICCSYLSESKHLYLWKDIKECLKAGDNISNMLYVCTPYIFLETE